MISVNNSQPKTKEVKGKSFFTFFLTALLGATVNFVSQIFYRKFFNFDTSVLLGYLTATVVSFLPTKNYAFAARETGNTGREVVKFLVIALVAWGVQVGMAVATLKWVANPYFPAVSLFWREKSSHVVGMGFSFLANYFGHKLLTFRSTGMYDRFKARSGRGTE
ncbi:GtrA family protein [Larkinella humicola]|uniref:GtrA family protein n=1 Tax=Larkinella humicola TaxID=2607654 RepID=A0A5N1JFF5_9BACT|nr:GtrA family protein [Larkinella humicola]KAA9352996.1 GtrA family protein [Larkinella humicola]